MLLLNQVVQILAPAQVITGGGKLNVDDYQRTVDTLLGSDSDPVINKEPVGAWTHKVWDAAFGS